MKRKMLSLLFLFVLVFIACSSKPENKVVSMTNDSIPEGAIPFEYGRTKKIILKGILNDSIQLNVTFDTGGGSCINLSDSLKGKFGLKKAGAIGKLQIGKYIKDQSIYFNCGKDISRILGTYGAIINWRYFENQIIKISFQNKYIQVLNRNFNKIGYDSTKMNIVLGRMLIVPLKINLQGKNIVENFLLDTGLSSYTCINNDIIDKYSLNMKDAENWTSTTIAGVIKTPAIKTDSIGVGKLFISGVMSVFGDAAGNNKLLSGLLGNMFLENFDVILDLKNFVLYMKPVEVSDNMIKSK